MLLFKDTVKTELQVYIDLTRLPSPANQQSFHGIVSIKKQFICHKNKSRNE
uniref:Uncharacterized protein n=1 Tax=Rhizophora mucronata TaxID=61149 RepID=A0A2P2MXB6_RHIMU